MASRQAISVGFPNPNYVNETGSRDAILPGEYLVETIVGPPPPPSRVRPWHHFVHPDDDEPEWLPLRRPDTDRPKPGPPSKIKPWHHELLPAEHEDEQRFIRRLAAPALPSAPRQHEKPWHHELLAGEDEEPPFFLGRRFAIGPVVPLIPAPALPWLRPLRPSLDDEETARDWTPMQHPAPASSSPPPVAAQLVPRLFIANVGRMMIPGGGR